MTEVSAGDRKWIPRPKTLKKMVVKSALFALGSAMEAACVLDPEVEKEALSWKDPFSILFQVLPDGPCMALAKRDGKVRYLGARRIDADLVVSFKNLEGAFLCMSGQIGTSRGYAESRMTLKGDASRAMSLIRALNHVQALLFPPAMARRVLRRVPKKSLLLRAGVLGVGVPLGLRRL